MQESWIVNLCDIHRRHLRDVTYLNREGEVNVRGTNGSPHKTGRPDSVELRNRTVRVDIWLCVSKTCTCWDVRFIKSSSSKFPARFITQTRLWRFFNRALPHDNQVSLTTFLLATSLVYGLSREIARCPDLPQNSYRYIRHLLIQERIPKSTSWLTKIQRIMIFKSFP